MFKEAQQNAPLSSGCCGAALGFPASAACRDEAVGGGGDGGCWGGGVDYWMWRQKGSVGKLQKGGIRSVQLY